MGIVEQPRSAAGGSVELRQVSEYSESGQTLLQRFPEHGGSGLQPWYPASVPVDVSAFDGISQAGAGAPPDWLAFATQ